MAQATAVYSTQAWDRKPWPAAANEGPGLKLGRVEMVHSYVGDIEGQGQLQYLFAFDESGGRFVGLEKVVGSIAGKSGSFILQFTGTTVNDRLQQVLTVVPGSGTGELSNLSGQATMDCDAHQEQYTLVLDYTL